MPPPITFWPFEPLLSNPQSPSSACPGRQPFSPSLILFVLRIHRQVEATGAHARSSIIVDCHFRGALLTIAACRGTIFSVAAWRAQAKHWFYVASIGDRRVLVPLWFLLQILNPYVRLMISHVQLYMRYPSVLMRKRPVERRVVHSTSLPCPLQESNANLNLDIRDLF